MGVISLNAAIGSAQRKPMGFALSDSLHGKHLCRSRETCPAGRLDAIRAIMPPQVSGVLPLKEKDSVLWSLYRDTGHPINHYASSETAVS
ncbi:hypothetical protein [Roseicyclus sp.]|uniref:hypothetical protein n=1 Tax=Roseicyclus sp. TaxID=1914329 RepID=UPI001BCB39F4|nr:hypothetical protein [Roseicyclus sp.]